MSQAHILVVDDEETVRDIVRRYLELDGNRVQVAASAVEAYAALDQDPPDLVILDVMLPGDDGLTILRRVRQDRPTLPVIMLTARADDADRILGLELGADDFVPKPFSPRELVARTHSVLRRSAPDRTASALVRSGNLTIDLECREVHICGRSICLTALEFDLLTHLARHPRRAFTRERLLQQVWGQTWLGDPSAVTVLVRRLREKIEDDPSTPTRLTTVYGVGYRLTAVGNEARSEVAGVAGELPGAATMRAR